MPRLTIIATAAIVMTFCAPAVAQTDKEFGDLQRYGGQWRYMHRDWSGVYGRRDPAVCWEWDGLKNEWIWVCSG